MSDTQKLYWYRCEVGCHGIGIPRKNAEGQEAVETILIGEGETFQSPIPNLVERLGADKFTKLPDNFDPNQDRQLKQAAPQLPGNTTDFNTWSEKELRDYAADEEIDLGNARNKADIIKVLKSKSPVSV